jgi:hypothetical protein
MAADYPLRRDVERVPNYEHNQQTEQDRSDDDAKHQPIVWRLRPHAPQIEPVHREESYAAQEPVPFRTVARRDLVTARGKCRRRRGFSADRSGDQARPAPSTRHPR